MPRKGGNGKHTLVRAFSDRDVDDLKATEPVSDHYKTQPRLFSKFDKELRNMASNIDIIIEENIYQLKTIDALYKPITAPLTEQTVMNSRLFQEMQRALHKIDVRIITVAVSTTGLINGTSGLRDTISTRHKDYFTNKCFLFAILEAFNRYSELLRPYCSTVPETVPEIIEHFTTNAKDATFLTNLANQLFDENVLLSLWDIENHPSLKTWADSSDDGHKKERLINLTTQLFRDALDDYKIKDTKASEITILLFAHFYDLRINVIPTRANPVHSFNQFGPPRPNEKTIELLNWATLHYDLLVRTKLIVEPTADQTMTPTLTPHTAETPADQITTPILTPHEITPSTLTTTPETTTASTVAKTINSHPTSQLAINTQPTSEKTTPLIMMIPST